MPRSIVRSVLVRPMWAIAATVVVTVAACTGDGEGEAAAVQSSAIEGLVQERVGPYIHVLADLDYPVPAPAGGDHPPSPYWLTCGVYDGAVPDELAVHSLEHGAVWIALGPDSSEEDRHVAAGLADGRKVIVSDVPDLPNPVELVAWGMRLPLDAADDPRAPAFLDAFIDGGGGPEAGSSCDSVGDPPTPPALPSE